MNTGTNLSFHPVLPWWVLLIFAIGGILLILRSYKRSGLIRENPALGWSLTALKIITLLFLIIMLSKPEVTLRHQKKEKADLLVLLDFSESMNIRDEQGNQTRFEAAQNLFSKKIQPQLGEDFNLKIFEFSSFLRPINSEDLSRQQMADGSSTDIGGSLEKALKGQSGHDAGAILLLSDGVHNTGRHPDEIIEQLVSRKIPLFTVGLGGKLEYIDVELNEVIVPELVYENEKVTLRVDLTAYGFEGQNAAIRLQRNGIADLGGRLNSDQVKVEEIGKQEVQLIGQGFRQRVEFPYQPKEIGDHHLKVEILPLPGESILVNNQSKEILSVVKRKIRVLLVEGSPRWGSGLIFRALRADRRFQVDSLTLVSEPDNLILPVGPGFGDQEGWGNHPRSRFHPLDPPFSWYDCIIFGDISPDWFKKESLEQFSRQVKDSGIAVIFLAGENTFHKESWGKSPLKEMIPVTLASTPVFRKIPTRFTPTTSGLLHPLLKIAKLPTEAVELWQSLPEGLGFFETDQLRPGAMILAEHPTEKNRNGNYPLLAFQRYGKGRVMAMMFEQHWFWAFSQEPTARKYQVFQQFWRGAVRYLVSGRSEEDMRGIHLQLEKEKVSRGEFLPVRAKVYGIESTQKTRVIFEIVSPDGMMEEYRAVVEPSPDTGVGVFYTTQLQPEQVGEYHLSAKLLQGIDLLAEDRSTFRVEVAAFEHRNAGLNAQLLQVLAKKTQGKYYNSKEAETLHQDLPPSEKIGVETQTRELWNSLIAFLLVVIAMNAEWIIRRWKDLS